MESVNLEMEDLFETGAVEDDYDQPQNTMAELDGEAEEGPMRDGGDGDNEDGPSDDVLAKLKDLKGAGKKRVMRPQPKLDGERLRSERGLSALPKLFENVKFKGKGHEAEDLKRMMGGLEHWAHRLYPKATFDEFIERMEKLGSKREIQTYVKRIRMDMPLTDEFAPPDDEDNDGGPPADDEDPFGAVGITAPMDEDLDMDAEEAYDAMLAAEREKMGDTPAKPSQAPSTPAPTPSTPALTPTSATPSAAGGMTPEVRARMEANKLKALQKRAAKLGVPVESLMLKASPVATPSSSQAAGPAASDSGIDSQDNASSQNTQPSQHNTQNTPAKASRTPDVHEEDDDGLMIDESEDSPSKHLHLRLTETEPDPSMEQDSMARLTDKDADKQISSVENRSGTGSESPSLNLRLASTNSDRDGGLNLQMEESDSEEAANKENSSTVANQTESSSNLESTSSKKDTGDLNLRMSESDTEPDLSLRLEETEPSNDLGAKTAST